MARTPRAHGRRAGRDRAALALQPVERVGARIPALRPHPIIKTYIVSLARPTPAVLADRRRSAEAMIREGYSLEPAEIAVAVEWLQLNPPDKPIALDQAVTLGKRGRPKKGEEKGSPTTIIGRGRARILARLDRDGNARQFPGTSPEFGRGHHAHRVQRRNALIDMHADFGNRAPLPNLGEVRCRQHLLGEPPGDRTHFIHDGRAGRSPPPIACADRHFEKHPHHPHEQRDGGDGRKVSAVACAVRLAPI